MAVRGQEGLKRGEGTRLKQGWMLDGCKGGGARVGMVCVLLWLYNL